MKYLTIRLEEHCRKVNQYGDSTQKGQALMLELLSDILEKLEEISTKINSEPAKIVDAEFTDKSEVKEVKGQINKKRGSK